MKANEWREKLDLGKPEVELTGEDGNVFNLIGATRRALKREKYPPDALADFSKEVMAAGSYDHALQIMMDWAEAL